jgi:hypothetical protein
MLLDQDEVTRRAFILALRAHEIIAEGDGDLPPEIDRYFAGFDAGAAVPEPAKWLADIPVSAAEQARITWREMLVVPLSHPLIIGYVAAAGLGGDLLRQVARTALQIDTASRVHRKAGARG